MSSDTFRLTTIGTGTAAPSRGRVSSGHLIEVGAVRLLMDCGSGVVHRMAERDIEWQSITHVAFTHFHLDHVNDFAPLIFAWKYGMMPPRSTPLCVIGPVGITKLLHGIAAALGEWVTAPGFPLEVTELPAGESLSLGEHVRLSSHKVPHTAESVAYSVECQGRRVVYTGDTGFDEAFAEWAAGCDVLLAECSLPESMAMAEHLTPQQCAALAERVLPRHLVLTHFYPPVELVDIAGIVGPRFAGALTLASDGWTLDIEDV